MPRTGKNIKCPNSFAGRPSADGLILLDSLGAALFYLNAPGSIVGKKDVLTYLPELSIFHVLFAVGVAGENTNKGKTVQNLFTRK